MKGGRKQRHAALKELARERSRSAERARLAERADEMFDSSLRKHLVKEWAWGYISATKLQRYAAMALEDEQRLLSRASSGSSSHMVGSASLRAFAALGTNGLHEGNISRDLLTLLGTPNLPPIHLETLPTRIPKMRFAATTPVKHGFLLPHQVFAHLYHSHRKRFNQIFVGSDDVASSLGTFWGTSVARRDPRLKGHPMATRSEWSVRAVPLALHGDAVPVVSVGKPGCKSLDTYSMMGILGKGATIQLKILLFSILDYYKAIKAKHK